jgi:hypothetical protein
MKRWFYLCSGIYSLCHFPSQFLAFRKVIWFWLPLSADAFSDQLNLAVAQVFLDNFD